MRKLRRKIIPMRSRVIYLRGDGVEKNEAKAREWLERQRRKVLPLQS
jgi:hypothetical protein